MTDLATAEPQPSTVLDTDSPTNPSGGGAPRTLESPEADKPEKVSLRDTIAAAVKENTSEEADDQDADPKPDAAKDKTAEEKGAEKPKGDEEAPEAKTEKKPAERAPDGKFAAKEEEDKSDKPAEQPNGRNYPEPPKSFLPDAREKWTNVPRPVQRDIEVMARTHEQEVAKYREAAERYEPIRQFDELVRQNGRAGIHETLAEVKQLEDMMEVNPLAALNQILQRAGPRKPDGSPISLFELAQAVVNSGQDGYNRAVAHQPQPQPQQNPEVEQLKRQLAEVQQQQLAAQVIEPFRASHPRYDELQDDIAFFLQSGKIPASLSPSERLEAAYDMAVRINPASHANDAAEPQADPDPGRRADTSFSGSKSIKSAPGAVNPDLEPERGGSIRDLLEAELRRSKRS